MQEFYLRRRLAPVSDKFLLLADNTYIVSWMGRWYSALDILDLWAYNESTYPSFLDGFPLNRETARKYFQWMSNIQ